MKLIGTTIGVLIIVIPVFINLIIWVTVNPNMDIVYGLYMMISTLYLGCQFTYFAILFTKWFNSKLK
jgi:hypothetical protein